jgi:hypothetical protein
LNMVCLKNWNSQFLDEWQSMTVNKQLKSYFNDAYDDWYEMGEMNLPGPDIDKSRIIRNYVIMSLRLGTEPRRLYWDWISFSRREFPAPWGSEDDRVKFI